MNDLAAPNPVTTTLRGKVQYALMVYGKRVCPVPDSEQLDDVWLFFAKTTKGSPLEPLNGYCPIEVRCDASRYSGQNLSKPEERPTQ